MTKRAVCTSLNPLQGSAFKKRKQKLKDRSTFGTFDLCVNAFPRDDYGHVDSTRGLSRALACNDASYLQMHVPLYILVILAKSALNVCYNLPGSIDVNFRNSNRVVFNYDDD